MTVEKGYHLNRLLQRLPPGLLVDTDWLQAQGLSHSRVHDYVKRGWLERLMPRVYRRPAAAGPVRWELAVVSAQGLVENPFHVGGPTALDLLGLSHFLDLGRKARVWLYDPGRTAPGWLARLPLDVDVRLSRRRLFGEAELGLEWRRLELGTGRLGGTVDHPVRSEPWDQFMRLAGAERATLELLEEVGAEVGFHTADKLFEGLANLRPAVMEELLRQCASVKAKRLFFFFSDRHGHAWARRLDAGKFDLGRGKRQIAKGGRLDPRYQITVPGELLRRGNESDGG